jgi:thiol-disulfide isomerase/thioredoxin
MSKKSKIIMAALLILACVASIISIVRLNVTDKEEYRQAALDFKNEYESINGKVIKGDLKQRDLDIPKDNPYIKTDIKTIVEKIKNKETFYLYVGDSLCPWCRSGLDMMIQVAKEQGVKDIYYIDFWDDNHKEILRDLYEVDTTGKKAKFKKTQDAVEGYDELIEAVKDYVQNYTIAKDGKTYDVGVKRTYGGDHFKFVDGKCIAYVSLRSDKLENALGELTIEVLKDQKDKFTEFFKATENNACTGESNC